MAIISVVEYPAVRAAVHYRLTSKRLPDDFIALPIFAPEAELDLLALLPNAETFTGTRLSRAKNVVIYWTAARLVPSIPQVTSHSFLGDRQSFQTIDWQDHIDYLLGKADENLGELGIFVNTIEVFKLQGGYREMLNVERVYNDYYPSFPPFYHKKNIYELERDDFRVSYSN